MQRIVGTRDDESVEAACDAVVGDENVVDLGDHRTLVVGPLALNEVRELAASDAVDYVETDRPVTAADAALATPAVQPVATPWGVDRIRTRRPAVDGRVVTFRGSLPRLEDDHADVWFSYQWRPRVRWWETSAQRIRGSGEFTATVRLFWGLTYYVRAHARFPDGSRVTGRRVRFRLPDRGKMGRPGGRRQLRRR